MINPVSSQSYVAPAQASLRANGANSANTTVQSVVSVDNEKTEAPIEETRESSSEKSVESLRQMASTETVQRQPAPSQTILSPRHVAREYRQSSAD